MALSTYTELKNAITEWLDGETDLFLVNRVPDFIRIFESRFSRRVRVRQMEITTTLAVVDGVAALPDDYRELARVRAGTTYLERAPADYIAMFGPDSTAPFYFTKNNTLLTGAAESVIIVYYASLPALSETNASNWLLAQYPDAYLYGSLVEAMTYKVDDTGLQRFTALYERALGELEAEDRSARLADLQVRPLGVAP